MKKTILGLILILSFAFTKAQQAVMDVPYFSDSTTISTLNDANGTTYKTKSTVTFSMPNIATIINRKDTIVAISEYQTDHRHSDDYCIQLYAVKVNGKDEVLGVKFLHNQLVSVGITDGESFQLIYINNPSFKATINERKSIYKEVPR